MESTESISASHIALVIIVFGMIISVSGALAFSVESHTVSTTGDNSPVIEQGSPDVIEYEEMDLEKRLIIDEAIANGEVTREGDIDWAGLIVVKQGSEQFTLSVDKSSPARNFVTASGLFISVAGIMLFRRYRGQEIPKITGISKTEDGEWKFEVEED